MNEALFSSVRTGWCTPSWILTLVEKVGPIGLDPCSNMESGVRATERWEKSDDGLSREWGGHGLVYVNPPYGREIGPWMVKCRDEGRRGVEIIALVPSRTDTRWFQDCALTADQILLYRGRLVFEGAPNAAPFPSAVLYWGRDVNRFCDAFAGMGAFFQVSR
jgi:site-specific DNA-methyltransferase (adenine-specific)